MDILIVEPAVENIIIYSFTAGLCIAIFFIYLHKRSKGSEIVGEKIRKAQEEGLHEPVSLHPVVDPNTCIGTGACVAACPEKDILGLRNGRATLINASRCIGHGACFHACPTEAISLRIGTDKRGVDLPHINQNFETNVPGIYIAGELGGMGLIKNAVEQGRQAAENIAGSLRKHHSAEFDIIIIGAGPAGISGCLTAKKHGLKYLFLEQDTLGGTVTTYPRKKIIMTSPMDIPLYGKVRLYDTTKQELLSLWQKVLEQNDIRIDENCKAENIVSSDGFHKVITSIGNYYTTASVLLATGRRGTPRKLNIPGETLEKVAYRLLEPEDIRGRNITIVGGGDSAIEAALMLCGNNNVTLSYRGESFSRIKPQNNTMLKDAAVKQKLEVLMNSNIISIEESTVTIVKSGETGEVKKLNDLVYIFAGGELPAQFLENAGIKVTRKFGETVMKH